MAVYEGVLENLSGGEVISSEGTGGYFTHRVGITRFHRTGVDRQAGWVQRQFVDIAGTRIKTVVLTPYHDALLTEAVGQDVALSVTGPPAESGRRHTVVAIWTPKGGIDRPSGKMLLAGSIWLVLKHWITAPLFFLIMLIPTWLASVIYSPLGWVVLATAAALSIWWLIVPFVHIKRTVRAAGALDKAPWTTMTMARLA